MTRRGSTLIELMITLAIMAVVASVVALALRPVAGAEADAGTAMASARRRALEERRPVTLELRLDGRTLRVTFFPDGGAIGDSALRVNRLTGVLANAR